MLKGEHLLSAQRPPLKNDGLTAADRIGQACFGLRREFGRLEDDPVLHHACRKELPFEVPEDVRAQAEFLGLCIAEIEVDPDHGLPIGRSLLYFDPGKKVESSTSIVDDGGEGDLQTAELGPTLSFASAPLLVALVGELNRTGNSPRDNFSVRAERARERQPPGQRQVHALEAIGLSIASNWLVESLD